MKTYSILMTIESSLDEVELPDLIIERLGNGVAIGEIEVDVIAEVNISEEDEA